MEKERDPRVITEKEVKTKMINRKYDAKERSKARESMVQIPRGGHGCGSLQNSERPVDQAGV